MTSAIDATDAVSAAAQIPVDVLCEALERRLRDAPASYDAEIIVAMLAACLSHVEADALAEELVHRLGLPDEAAPVARGKRAYKRKPLQRVEAERACEVHLWPIAEPDDERIVHLVADRSLGPGEVFSDRLLIDADDVPAETVKHIMRLAARIAFDLDFAAVDELRNTLTAHGVYGRHAVQADNAFLLDYETGLPRRGKR